MKNHSLRKSIFWICILCILCLGGCNSCNREFDEEKWRRLIAEYDTSKYVIYFNSDVDAATKARILDTLENKYGHKQDALGYRKCGCSEQYLMVNTTGLDPKENIASADEDLEETGHIGRNFKLKIGPVGGLRGGFVQGPINNNANSIRNSATANDPSVVVGIVDLGIDFNHGSLSRYIWRSSDARNDCFPTGIESYNFREDNKNDIFDQTGHGTHIAGIIALDDQEPGNPSYGPGKDNLRLMSLKITTEGKSNADLPAAICAINYAIDNGVDILNLSWGYYALKPDSGFAATIRKAKTEGVLVVAASGNDSANTDTFPHWPSSFSSIAGYENVISVAALNETLDSLARFSNYGRESVQFAAPGTNVFSSQSHDVADVNCGNMSGTSMAAPFVTRMAAIIKIKDSDMGYVEIKNKIKDELLVKLSGGHAGFPKKRIKSYLPSERIKMKDRLECPSQ